MRALRREDHPSLIKVFLGRQLHAGALDCLDQGRKSSSFASSTQPRWLCPASAWPQGDIDHGGGIENPPGRHHRRISLLAGETEAGRQA